MADNSNARIFIPTNPDGSISPKYKKVSAILAALGFEESYITEVVDAEDSESSIHLKAFSIPTNKLAKAHNSIIATTPPTAVPIANSPVETTESDNTASEPVALPSDPPAATSIPTPAPALVGLDIAQAMLDSLTPKPVKAEKKVMPLQKLSFSHALLTKNGQQFAAFAFGELDKASGVKVPLKKLSIEICTGISDAHAYAGIPIHTDFTTIFDGSQRMVFLVNPDYANAFSNSLMGHYSALYDASLSLVIAGRPLDDVKKYIAGEKQKQEKKKAASKAAKAMKASSANSATALNSVDIAAVLSSLEEKTVIET